MIGSKGFILTAVRDQNSRLTKATGGQAKLCDVSVVIVSYNVATLLAACLESLQNRTADGLTVEIIVVDNASFDDSAERVRRDYPTVRLIENQHNGGFGRGCNQGLREATGRYVFFLNPDATLGPQTLPILLEFMEKRPQVGIVGPLVRYPDGRLQPTRRRFGGPLLPLVESTLLQHQTPLRNLTMLKRYYYEDQPAEGTQEVDWIVGAAFLVRRAVLDEIGGLDERFFMYSEEVDFCRRAKERGWQVWYVPTAQVTHQEGQSSRQNVAARYINFHTSKVAYYRKYYGPVYAAFLRTYLLGLHGVEYAQEWAKLRLGHKPVLRRERLSMLKTVISTGFRPYRSTRPTEASQLKLCLLSAEFFPQAGGLGDYTARLAQAFEEVGVSTQILTGAINQPPNANLPGPARWNWRSLPTVARVLRLRQAEVVNIQYQTGAYGMHPAINFLPLYLGWRMGTHRPKIVTTFHDLRVPYLFPKAGPVRGWVNRLLLRTSDAAIITNEADRRQALAWGMRPDRLHLVPIGSNIEPSEGGPRRTETHDQLGLIESDFAVGYFGLVNRSKGLDTLLEAFARLKGDGWKLVIVGGETGQTDLTNKLYADELASLTERLGLTDRIIRPGHRPAEETSELLTALDALALPFRDGASFGRGSLLAALAHGLPTVTTRPQTLPQADEPAQLLDGQNVLLIEPNDPADLAKALEKLRSDPNLRDSLSRGAVALSRHFSWPTIADQLLEIYQSLIP